MQISGKFLKKNYCPLIEAQRQWGYVEFGTTENLKRIMKVVMS